MFAARGDPLASSTSSRIKRVSTVRRSQKSRFEDHSGRAARSPDPRQFPVWRVPAASCLVPVKLGRQRVRHCGLSLTCRLAQPIQGSHLGYRRQFAAVDESTPVSGDPAPKNCGSSESHRIGTLVCCGALVRLWQKAAEATRRIYVSFWGSRGIHGRPASAAFEAYDPSATLAVHCGNGFDAGFSPYQSTRFRR